MRVDPATIRSWRRAGYGPPAVKFGAKRLYRESAVIAWEAEREREAIEEARADRERSAPP
jgi:hypothetical protein